MKVRATSRPYLDTMQRTVRSASLTAIALSIVCCEPPRSDTAGRAAPMEPVASEEDPPEPSSEALPIGSGRTRTVYVPAYSHLPKGEKSRALMSILLSVRNVDSAATVALTQVDYFDTAGHRVRRYLTVPRALRPLETAEFSVASFDEAGGSGANFLVHWEGPEGAHPLLTEAVMLGHLGTGYVSFTSRGIELDQRSAATDAKSEGDAGATKGAQGK